MIRKALRPAKRLLGQLYRQHAARQTLKGIGRLDHPSAAAIATGLATRPHYPRADKGVIEEIEAQRRHWLADNRSLSNLATGFNSRDLISKACNASKPPPQCLQLLHLARALKPRATLELGTNLGISSAYLGLASRAHNGRVVTVEGSEARATLAAGLHEALGLENVQRVTGKFQVILPKTLEQHGPFDLAFIDGHHQLEPTLTYTDQIIPHLSKGAVIVYDDIDWSEGMIQAWEHISNDRRFAFAITCKELGMVALKQDTGDEPPESFTLHTR